MLGFQGLLQEIDVRFSIVGDELWPDEDHQTLLVDSVGLGKHRVIMEVVHLLLVRGWRQINLIFFSFTNGFTSLYFQVPYNGAFHLLVGASLKVYLKRTIFLFSFDAAAVDAVPVGMQNKCRLLSWMDTRRRSQRARGQVGLQGQLRRGVVGGPSQQGLRNR